MEYTYEQPPLLEEKEEINKFKEIRDFYGIKKEKVLTKAISSKNWLSTGFPRDSRADSECYNVCVNIKKPVKIIVWETSDFMDIDEHVCETNKKLRHYLLRLNKDNLFREEKEKMNSVSILNMYSYMNNRKKAKKYVSAHRKLSQSKNIAKYVFHETSIHYRYEKSPEGNEDIDLSLVKCLFDLKDFGHYLSIDGGGDIYISKKQDNVNYPNGLFPKATHIVTYTIYPKGGYNDRITSSFEKGL